MLGAAQAALLGAATFGKQAQGIQIPDLVFQTISDSVPGGAIWWNPTTGSDANDGSIKAQAKATFGAAQALVSSGGTIVATGGTHVVPEIAVSKSITLMAEPGAEVVLYRDARFRGAWERTWTWTLVDATRKIWESPAIAHGLAANTRLSGFIVIPDGGLGKHLMRLPGMESEAAFKQNGNGGLIDDGDYGVPWLWVPDTSRIRIRMQKPPASYVRSEWPTDGRMGTLIGPSGVWQEPVTENPNDYQIQIVPWSGEGTNLRLFSITASDTTIKGMNAALAGRAFHIDDAQNVTVEKGTYFVDEVFVKHRGNTDGFTARRVRAGMGDQRHISWSDYKIGGRLLTWMRGHMLGNDGNTVAGTNKNCRFEHSMFRGFFDLALPYSGSDGPIEFDHCAIIRNVDDGLQNRADGNFAVNISYTYWRGGPMGGWEQAEAGSPIDHTHHTIYHNDTPLLWGGGVHPHVRMPTHTTGSAGPVRPLRIYYSTFIQSPDTENNYPMRMMHGGKNLTSGNREHWNNILVLMDNKRYTGSGGDAVAQHLNVQQSTAGTIRSDYNLYYRDVPSPSTVFFNEIGNSFNSGEQNFASLAAFRASARYTTSAGMYTDGTAGHEQHGVQEDPRFVHLAAMDYRPQSNGAKSGAKNLTASGWLGTETFENWKGALDPKGHGNEVGPQNP